MSIFFSFFDVSAVAYGIEETLSLVHFFIFALSALSALNKKAKNRYLRTSRVACRVDLEPTADGRSDSYPPPSPTARTPR